MKTINKAATLLVIVITLASCNPFEPKPTETPTPVSRSRDVEEARIYSLLLNTDPERYLANSPTIIIDNVTYLGADSDTEYILKKEPTLEKETLENLRAINEKNQIINLTLSLNKPYEILSSGEIDKRINENPDWLRTYTITQFSKIGFNQDLDQALVYMEHFCGGECAIGSIYFLVLNKDIWEIKSVIVSWIS